MKNLNTYLYFLLFFFFANVIVAQKETSKEPFYFEKIPNFSFDNRLSQNSVLSISQDNVGFMWFGTWAGLDRFDGKHYKNYRHDPTDTLGTTLTAGGVLSLKNIQQNLWIGTEGGLSRIFYDATNFDYKVERVDEENGYILLDGNEVNLFGVTTASNQIYQLDIQSKNITPLVTFGVDTLIQTINYLSKQRILFIGTNKGGLVFNLSLIHI